jgi:hypothetical protein
MAANAEEVLGRVRGLMTAVDVAGKAELLADESHTNSRRAGVDLTGVDFTRMALTTLAVPATSTRPVGWSTVAR